MVNRTSLKLSPACCAVRGESQDINQDVSEFCTTMVTDGYFTHEPSDHTSTTSPFSGSNALVSLQCPYCSNPTELIKDAELSTADWARVFEESAELGVLQVSISGGEPAGRDPTN